MAKPSKEPRPIDVAILISWLVFGAGAATTFILGDKQTFASAIIGAVLIVLYTAIDRYGKKAQSDETSRAHQGAGSEINNRQKSEGLYS